MRGEADINSDLDVLVGVGDEVSDTRKESVHIRRKLRGISMPMDIIVLPENNLKQLARAPGLIYREALEHRKVVYDGT